VYIGVCLMTTVHIHNKSVLVLRFTKSQMKTAGYQVLLLLPSLTECHLSLGCTLGLLLCTMVYVL